MENKTLKEDNECDRGKQQGISETQSSSTNLIKKKIEIQIIPGTEYSLTNSSGAPAPSAANPSAPPHNEIHAHDIKAYQA